MLKNKKIMYVILKHIKETNGTTSTTSVIDSHAEVLEFNTIEEAEYIRDILQVNSKSGRNTYVINQVN